jgi:acyl-[acyl carrier protein]--UDP-N-acetylglucosamine O-acyltransferase
MKVTYKGIYNMFFSKYHITRRLKNIIYRSNIEIGKNNYISPEVIIGNNVKIGENNKIYGNTILHPNTVIGDNNYIYPECKIGDIPSCAKRKSYEYNLELFKGVSIGDNNYIHNNVRIQAGIYKKSVLGNNNKLLGAIDIGHDINIDDNVTIYPGVMVGGNVDIKNGANIGMRTVINQKIVIGQYSMVASNSAVVKHIFPFYININNNIHRLNISKLPEYINDKDDIVLREIYNSGCVDIQNINKYIKKDIDTYYNSANAK